MDILVILYLRQPVNTPNFPIVHFSDVHDTDRERIYTT